MKKEPQLSFKNKSDKATALEEFSSLKNHPGWKRLVVYYDNKIEWLQKIINGDVASDDGLSIVDSVAKLELYRARRNMAIQFKNLPDILIEFIEVNSGNKINLDPFE